MCYHCCTARFCYLALCVSFSIEQSNRASAPSRRGERHKSLGSTIPLLSLLKREHGPSRSPSIPLPPFLSHSPFSLPLCHSPLSPALFLLLSPILSLSATLPPFPSHSASLLCVSCSTTLASCSRCRKRVRTRQEEVKALRCWRIVPLRMGNSQLMCLRAGKGSLHTRSFI